MVPAQCFRFLDRISVFRQRERTCYADICAVSVPLRIGLFADEQ